MGCWADGVCPSPPCMGWCDSTGWAHDAEQPALPSSVTPLASFVLPHSLSPAGGIVAPGQTYASPHCSNPSPAPRNNCCPLSWQPGTRRSTTTPPLTQDHLHHPLTLACPHFHCISNSFPLPSPLPSSMSTLYNP